MSARRVALALLALCAGAAAAVLFLGPRAPGDIAVQPKDVSLQQLAAVPAGRWQALAQQRIFFGHQSVGVDILDGIADIQVELPAIGLVRTAGGPDAQPGKPGLMESPIGSNTDPESKIRDFVEKLRQAGPGGADIALMKFCYVDVFAGVDVDKLFTIYKQAMANVQQALPKTTIVHCTVPLTASRSGWRSRLKRLLGKVPQDDDDDRARHRFNERLRAEYGGKQPMFDLAAAESTLPDGSRTECMVDGEPIPCLAACYTHDGGHLNATGRRAVARELLGVLAGLAER